MTTVNPSTSTFTSTPNVGNFSTQIPNPFLTGSSLGNQMKDTNILNVFNPEYVSAPTQPQQPVAKETPQVLNENPDNLASKLIGEYYQQALMMEQLTAQAQYQAQAQQNAQAQAQPQQPVAAQTSSTPAATQSAPTMEDFAMATQIANTVAKQYSGCTSFLPDSGTTSNQGWYSPVVSGNQTAQTQPAGALNYNA